MVHHRANRSAGAGLSVTKAVLIILAGCPSAAAPAQEPLVLSRMGRESRVAARIGQVGQERRTHRGWEVYGDQMMVLANSSQEHARMVAERFQAAVADSRRQLELLTGPLPRGDRARGSVQINVDQSTWRGAAPPPLIRRSGLALSVYLNVGDGRPPLAAQLDQLDQAAAVLVVESQLAGQAVPEAIRVGLASFLTPNSDIQLANSADRTTSGARLLPTDEFANASQIYQQLRADSVARGRHPWTQEEHPTRGAPERDGAADDREASASRELVKFLLTGYDGRFAADFGRALRAAVAQQESAQLPQRQRPREIPTTRDSAGPLAQFIDALQPRFQAWQQDPTVGQPRWEPLEKDNAQLTEHQRELLFVLRLLQRGSTASVRQIEPRVIEVSASGATPQSPKPAVGRPIDLSQWVRGAGLSADHWAIVDANGLLVWNHDSDALRQRLALGSGRYEAVWREGRIVAREPVGNGQVLEAWLEPQPGDALASTARFAIRTEN